MVVAEALWHHVRSVFESFSRMFAMNPGHRECVSATFLVVASVAIKVQRWQAEEFVEVQSGWRDFRWQGAALDVGEKHQNPTLVVNQAERQQVEVMLGERGYRQRQEQVQLIVDYPVDEPPLGLR
jgi:hypothetical protein